VPVSEPLEDVLDAVVSVTYPSGEQDDLMALVEEQEDCA
jgi:hypothetical protein